ncbi:hypothetical protein GCM10023321_25980 [Pseudonocardia eucalypti]|uniref:Type II toxin-antitoxin system mRNA interferase toxin, RelE/StbE family n=1 Tax=Pseudonocardia eucalypti TaxID=648755 RepID=A0ABP9PYU6_9PSEU|nr:addiction module RelE/StbE family toxin [Pseudonocardia eucalypti]
MKLLTDPIIETTPNFRTQLKASPRAVRFAFADAIQVFVTDPHHESLHNHSLRDRYAGFRSINVTSDWRAVYRIVTTGSEQVVTFHFLGTHDQLYGKP